MRANAPWAGESSEHDNTHGAPTDTAPDATTATATAPDATGSGGSVSDCQLHNRP